MNPTLIVRSAMDQALNERHEFPPGMTLAEALMLASPTRWDASAFEVFRGSVAINTIIALDDAPDIVLLPGEIWHVVLMPSEPVTIGAMITAVAGVVGSTTAATIIVYAAMMAISMAISFGVSMLLAPSMQNNKPSADNDSPSALNSLSPPRNVMRAGSRVPEIYGRLRVWPDLLFPAWQQWTHIRVGSGGGNENKQSTSEQIVTAVYCIGRGHYQMDSFKFAETDVATLNGAVHIYPPGWTLPEWIRLPRPVANLNRYEFRELGHMSPDWDVPGDNVSELHFQIVFPGGIYQTHSGRDGMKFDFQMVEFFFQADRYDKNGNWQERWESRNQTGDATRNELRMTFNFNVNPGRWRVRCMMSNQGFPTSVQVQTTEKAFLEGIVGFERLAEHHRRYEHETVIVVQATNRGDNATQNLENFNLIATRVLPSQAWGSPAGTEGQWTANEEWLTAAMHTLTDPFCCNYSREMVDWDSLIQVHASLVRMGENNFSGGFDRHMTAEEQLQQIARKARSHVFISGGRVTFARDERKPAVSALFNRRNRIFDKSSTGLGLRFPGPDEHDAIEIQWIDSANEFRKRTYTYPEGVTPLNPLTIDFLGATRWHEVWRRARYEWAIQRYRRRTVPLRATEEAQLLLPFDRVSVVDHWDEGVIDGEVLEVSGTYVRLDREVVGVITPDAGIRFRSMDGRETSLHKFVQATAKGDSWIELLPPYPSFQLVGPSEDRQLGTLYNISTHDATELARRYLVTGSETDDSGVTLSLIHDDDRVYSETDDPAVPPVPPILQTY